MLLRGARGSAGYFDVFQIKPALGRTFRSDEEQPGKDHVVVLSHRLWTSQFGADPEIVGRSLSLDGEPYTVIGVMPQGSAFDRGWSQFWRPLTFKPGERTRNFHWLQVYGRLEPGVLAHVGHIGRRLRGGRHDRRGFHYRARDVLRELASGRIPERALQIIVAVVLGVLGLKELAWP